MRKYWFDSLTVKGRIETLHNWRRKKMIEETKAAGKMVTDPASISWVTYAWVIFLAMWGGLVRVMREHKFGEKRWPELFRLFMVEMTTSAFVGVLTFYLCEASDIRPLYTAVLTSTAGWMGVRALAVLESIYKARNGGSQ